MLKDFVPADKRTEQKSETGLKEGERNRESERDTLKKREREKGWVAFQC